MDVTKVVDIDIDANLDVARRSMQNNDYERAIRHLQRVLELRKNDLSTQCLLADAYLEIGEYENAITTYEKLSEPTLPESISNRICARKAIALYYQGEKSASVEALQQCIKLFPTNPESFCFLGQIQASQEIPSQIAIDNLNKAINLDSNYVEAWYQLARYNMETKQYLKARELLFKAIEINPLHGKSQSRLGMVYYYLHNFDLAKKAYQTALAINPEDFNTHYNLGEVYYADNDTVRAIKEFKQTLNYNPGHVEANFKLGLLLLANNMVKEAIFHFEQANHNKENDPRILIQLAISYERISEKNRALSIYNSVIEIDPLNIIAQQKIKYLTQELNQ